VSPPARAAVACLVSCAALACSSTSGSPGEPTGDAGADDVTTDGGGAINPGTGAEAGAETGIADAPLESATNSGPCDASIVLPTDGSTGTACGKCIEDHCASSLATCQLDCLCVSSIECLSVNDDNYTLCPDALSAIGAGNAGLTAVAGCIAMNCLLVCNPTD
jgi:hypothetical protein